MNDLPEYYFRLREHGAAVFRVATEPRTNRLTMTEIAAVNARSGKVRVQGEDALSAADEAAIATWLEARQAELALASARPAQVCLEQLGATAHWAQSKADPVELEAVTDALLLAMHDLRRVLVRKTADRVSKDAG